MFSFVSSWNEFFFALVLLQSPENYTLPITLSTFVGGEGKVALGPLAAGSVLAAIPSIVFFAIMRRRLTGGLLSRGGQGMTASSHHAAPATNPVRKGPDP